MDVFLGFLFYFEFLYVQQYQGGHGTGKTGNLVINFTRQRKHREFRYNTDNLDNTEFSKFP